VYYRLSGPLLLNFASKPLNPPSIAIVAPPRHGCRAVACDGSGRNQHSGLSLGAAVRVEDTVSNGVLRAGSRWQNGAAQHSGGLR
jgi:hypothetical protein